MAASIWGMVLRPTTTEATAGCRNGNCRAARGSEIPANTRFGRMARFSDRYMNDENWRIVEGLSAFCEARGRSLLELAFSWLLSHPALASVIAGATRPEQIEANVKAAAWELTPAEIAEVNAISAKG